VTGAALVTMTALFQLEPAHAAQAAQIGQVCLTNTDVAVITTGGSYGLPAGSGFRIVRFAENSYYGHGSGYPNGFITPRSVLDQNACRD
jgi:hypothetical protein